MTDKQQTISEPGTGRFKQRLQKYGFWGVIFFSLKGLAWLLVPFLIARGCG